MLLIPACLGIVFLIGIFTGCADPDGAVGNGVLGDHLTGEPHEIVLYPDIDTLSHTVVPTGNSNRDLDYLVRLSHQPPVGAYRE